MEIKANQLFERYAYFYYDKDYLTSVYFFDTDDQGFGSCWLVKKCKFISFYNHLCVCLIALKYPGAEEDSVWDSINVVKTTLESENKARYKVTSTVFLTL
jgi:hypothetical protein